MIHKTEITGIVLAGGKSRRMGTDKGLMIFRGKPLVQYSIDLLSQFCSRILVSSNNPEYRDLGYEVIEDEVSGAGPMAGIASCLRHSKTDLNLVLSCDMPLAESVIFETLLNNITGNTFVVPIDNVGRAEPLCAFYHKNSLVIMERLLNEKSFRMTDLFLQAQVKNVTPGEYPVRYQEQWFVNLNSLDDIKTTFNS